MRRARPPPRLARVRLRRLLGPGLRSALPRRLISLGVAQSIGVALLATFISLSDSVKMPDEQESFWLSTFAVLSVVCGLGIALLPALRNGDPVSRLFTDHVTTAFAAHVAGAYGDMPVVEEPSIKQSTTAQFIPTEIPLVALRKTRHR